MRVLLQCAALVLLRVLLLLLQLLLRSAAVPQRRPLLFAVAPVAVRACISVSCFLLLCAASEFNIQLEHKFPAS